MAGAYLAHSVYGFFQNGGGLCWVVRVGSDGGDGAGRPGPGGAAGGDQPALEAFRAVALPGVTDDVSVELSEEPRPPPPEGEGEGDGGGGKEPEPTYRLVVTAGPSARSTRASR